MLLSKGTRVKLKHTGEEGIVLQLLGERMVNVKLIDANMDIPVFEDDLVYAENFWQGEISLPDVPAKFTGNKTQQTTRQEIPPPNTFIPYKILKHMGLLLAFDPVYALDGQILSYKIYLINDTGYELLVVADLSVSDSNLLSCDMQLASDTSSQIGQLVFDDLNRSPVFNVKCIRITTSGQKENMSKELKIKPQQFFKNIKAAPFLNKQVHLFVIFDQWKTTEARPESLETYTKRHSAKSPVVVPEDPNPFKRIKLPEVSEVAGFIPEIDLHIEQLTGNYLKLSNIEIIQIQLQHFNQIMEKAIRLGIPKVFIIHGIGEGKLKNLIANKLLQYPEVAHFKNEYHHKYGFGATEVLFADK